jgi:acyl-CoA reductase-like NAD-dependent aldehyde dehydrogenase
VGDPLDDRTMVGPVVSEQDAERIEAQIAEAVAAGARVLAGGTRAGSLVRPTVLTGTTPDMKVCADEAFAPLLVLERFEHLAQAIAAVDRSRYGLQAGIFTRDLGTALAAFEGIEVGALVVNDAPTYRADHMPYGGVKGSGIGREGPRFAIEDYTETRLLVVSPPPLQA